MVADFAFVEGVGFETVVAAKEFELDRVADLTGIARRSLLMFLC